MTDTQKREINGCRSNILGSTQPCMNCGEPVAQKLGRKEKKFCSDRCRNAWWLAHTELDSRKAVYNFVCPNCRKPFRAYGNAHRKYCSHECYIEDRFGGGRR